MIKIVCTSVLFAVLFLACMSKSKSTPETLKMALIKGPTAMAFVELLGDTAHVGEIPLEMVVCDNPDQVKALLMRQEIDVAVLPISMAANLYNKGLPYRLLGCPVWGNLFWVTRPRSQSQTPLLSVFSRGSTVDVISRYLLDKKQMENIQLDYRFTTPQSVVQALLAGETFDAVLPEPFVSLALRRDTSLRVFADWAVEFSQQAQLLHGFPQTAVVVGERVYTDSTLITKINKRLALAVRFAASQEKALLLMVSHSLLPDTIGASKTIQRCRFRYLQALFVQQSVDSLFKILYLYEPKAIGGQMVDDQFFVNQAGR